MRQAKLWKTRLFFIRSLAFAGMRVNFLPQLSHTRVTRIRGCIMGSPPCDRSRCIPGMVRGVSVSGRAAPSRDRLRNRSPGGNGPGGESLPWLSCLHQLTFHFRTSAAVIAFHVDYITHERNFTKIPYPVVPRPAPGAFPWKRVPQVVVHGVFLCATTDLAVS